MSQAYMHPSSHSMWAHQQPPYPGAPPIPAGMNIKPSDWAKGTWSYQPRSSSSAAAAAQPAWAPAAAWHGANQLQQVRPPQLPQQQHQQQHQQQQASYNPYKRQPKPPSAEYLATKLVENPLGLTDMVPRKDLYGAENAPTPWTWHPRRLEEEDEDAESSTDDEDSPSPSPSRRQHPRHHRTDPPPQPHSSSSRSLARHASEPPPDLGRSSSRGVSSASAAASPSSRSSQNRQSSSSSSASQSNLSRQGSAPPPDMSYTAKSPLRPTFSPSIIRTPDYYNTHSISPSRSSSITPSSTPSSRRGSEDSIGHVTNGLDRMSFSHLSSSSSSSASSASTATLGRQSSLPLYAEPTASSGSTSRSKSSFSGTSHLVEEPTEMLSPLIMDQTPQPSSHRQLSRGGSMPPAVSGGGNATGNGLGPIQERSRKSVPRERSSTSSGHYASQQQSSSASPAYVQQQQQHHRSGSRSRTTSSATQSPYSSASQSRASSAHPSPTASRSHGNTPPSTHNYTGSHNPLPAPPVESTYMNGIYGQPNSSSSASAAAAYQQHQQQGVSASSASAAAARHHHSSSSSRSHHRDHSKTPSPPDGSSSKKVRKGYWNRRGDHVTGQYIVYAPRDMAYPEELSRYPADDFMNHKGERTPPYNRPELPESLPSRGQPPKRPYETFITYSSK